jgi:hypothetical protein
MKNEIEVVGEGPGVTGTGRFCTSEDEIFRVDNDSKDPQVVIRPDGSIEFAPGLEVNEKETEFWVQFARALVKGTTTGAP